MDNSENEHYISYLLRANKNGTHWYYPEEAEIRKTNEEQIIARNLVVKYHCYAVIRCGIYQDLASKINKSFSLATSKL